MEARGKFYNFGVWWDEAVTTIRVETRLKQAILYIYITSASQRHKATTRRI